MYRDQDWDTPLPRAPQPEHPDDGGWQDWPPCDEIRP